MDAATENSLRQAQVESFGRLMAGFSHDMKNHLSIIRESNGLMSDLIEMSEEGGGKELSVKRLKKAISSIEQRVIVVANTLHHLSRFSHRSDLPCSSFQINDLITEEHTLLERFSRLQQIDVTLELGEGLSTIYNDPSLLHHIFYRLYIFCLERLNPGDNLAIITRQNEKAVEITFRFTDILLANHKTLSDENLFAAIQKLQGTLEIGAKTKEHSQIVITIPPLGLGIRDQMSY